MPSDPNTAPASSSLVDPELERPAPVALFQNQLMLPKTGTMDILSIIRIIFSFYENESMKKNEKRLNRYFHILRICLREPGLTIIKYILNVQGFTETELVELCDVPASTVNRMISTLQDAYIVRKVGFVGRPYRCVGGKRVSVYLLDGADTSRAHEAQRRYGEILESRVETNLRQTGLEEAFNIIKVYMDKRSTNIIPEYWHINEMLKEKSVPCDNLPLLINKLKKAGYEWR